MRFGEEQRCALRAQAQSFKDHADALCGEASKRGSDWRQMLDELAATRHQIASERSDNAREHAQMREQRARDIDDEEERQRRAAKDAARERTEAFNAEREALAAQKAADAHRLMVDRAEIKANMDFKCGVDPVKRFLAGLAGSVADSVQLAERRAGTLVEAPAPAPTPPRGAGAGWRLCGPGDGRGLWRGLRRRAAGGRGRPAGEDARGLYFVDARASITTRADEGPAQVLCQGLGRGAAGALVRRHPRALRRGPRPGDARRGGGARRGLVLVLIRCVCRRRRVCPGSSAAGLPQFLWMGALTEHAARSAASSSGCGLAEVVSVRRRPCRAPSRNSTST